MRLRPYDPADEDALVRVWFDAWRSTGLHRPGVTQSDLAARAPKELATRWTVTVAEQKGEVVGFLALALKERRIDQLFVRPDVQGCGIGGALFDVAVARLPEGLWLRTQVGNRRAREFYERRGMILDRIDGAPGDERAIYAFPPPGR